jgi:hypothetical protein
VAGRVVVGEEGPPGLRDALRVLEVVLVELLDVPLVGPEVGVAAVLRGLLVRLDCRLN